tara:strand:- start:197 stop:439 length:243 start_codon:yes stop_codon:yes gene_type:complete
MQITDFEREAIAEGRNISDADRARARAMAAEARRAKQIEDLLAEGRNISDADRARAAEKYIKRNDGGMAMSGRGKPVRTF